MLKSIRALAVGLTAAAGFAAVAFAENPMVGGAPMLVEKNIVQNALNSGDHKTLVAAVKAAGLVDTLAGEGPFTVFAPTDAAFKRLPKGTVETLLKPENKDQLTKILTCHVVGKKVLMNALKGMIINEGGSHPFTTVGGCEFTAVRTVDGGVLIKDGAGGVSRVTIANVEQSNGVIHVIDRVLLPAS